MIFLFYNVHDYRTKNYKTNKINYHVALDMKISIYNVNYDNTELSLEQDFGKIGIRGSFIIPIGVESRCEGDKYDKKLL